MTKSKNTKQPLISVISVVLNNREGIQKTLESLQSQTTRNFEWVVVDGESTDGTREWLENCKPDFDFRYISRADGGIFDAMNDGIPLTNGEYLLFLNTGDELATTLTLETTEMIIDKAATKPAFLYGDCFERIGKGNDIPYIRRANLHENYKNGMFTAHQAMLYRRDHLNGLRYDTDYLIASAYDFTCSFITDLAEDRVVYLNFPISIVEPAGISDNHPEIGRQEQYIIRQRLGLCDSPVNWLIYLRQTISLNTRRLAPHFYMKCRDKLIRRS